MNKPKLLVIGHGRHGKDTVSEILQEDFKLSFISSSMFACQRFIYDDLKVKYDYNSFEECYADRHNHRSEWYDAIAGYCEDDPAQLGKDIFAEHDIYCGLRNVREFDAMKEQGVFDAAIWVDRSDHLPQEDRGSMTLNSTMADYIIDNNSALENLGFEVRKTYNLLSRDLRMKQKSMLSNYDYNHTSGFSHG